MLTQSDWRLARSTESSVCGRMACLPDKGYHFPFLEKSRARRTAAIQMRSVTAAHTMLTWILKRLPFEIM